MMPHGIPPPPAFYGRPFPAHTPAGAYPRQAPPNAVLSPWAVVPTSTNPPVHHATPSLPAITPHPTTAPVPPNTVGTPSAPEAPPEWNFLYEAARQGDAARLLELLRPKDPRVLWAPGPYGSSPLHGAVVANSPACVALLMEAYIAADRQFAPEKLRNKFGETPVDHALVPVPKPECLRALGIDADLTVDPRASNMAVAPNPLDRRTFNQAFLYHTQSPFIGDFEVVFTREAIPLETITEGLSREERLYLMGKVGYAKWLEQREKYIHDAKEKADFWTTHPSADLMNQMLTAAYRSPDVTDLFKCAIRLYTMESFLYRAVNTAARQRDASKAHLAPYARVLQSALQSLPAVYRHRGRCYRALKLDPTLQDRYRSMHVKHFNFEGFTSVSTDAAKAMGVQSDGNTLFVIEPGDAEDDRCCPVDIRHMSVYPEEDESLYPMGQQFEWVAVRDLTQRELRDYLGVTARNHPPPTSPSNSSVLVVELRAVNVFWPLCLHLFDDGNDIRASLPVLRRRLAADVARHGADSLEAAKAYSGLARCLSDMGQYDEALELHHKALAIRLRQRGGDHPSVATTCGNMGSVYISQGDYPQALEYHGKALRIRLTALGDDHPDVADTYNNIGLVYKAQGDYPMALEVYRKALRIWLKALGDDHPSVATTCDNMGSVYDCQGDYVKALEYHGKALRIRLKVLGDDHPDVAITYNNLGNVYESQGDYPKALEYYGDALGIWLKALGEDHPDVATTYNNLGNVYQSQGDYAKALEYHEKALRIRLKVLGDDHPDVANTYHNIGLVYLSHGEYSKALEYYRDALHIMFTALGKDHPDVATTLNSIGSVYEAQGDYSQALEYHGKALRIRRTALGDDHPDVAALYRRMGDVCDSIGDHDRARWYHEQASRRVIPR